MLVHTGVASACEIKLTILYHVAFPPVEAPPVETQEEAQQRASNLTKHLAVNEVQREDLERPAMASDP